MAKGAAGHPQDCQGTRRRNLDYSTHSCGNVSEAGGLMNYNIDVAHSFRQDGVYCGAILKGAN
jgi:hypothetical protein